MYMYMYYNTCTCTCTCIIMYYNLYSQEFTVLLDTVGATS